MPLSMVGFYGTTLPAPVAKALRDGRICGVALFSRNCGTPEQVRELCKEIRAAVPINAPPPLIAVDQEGGRVFRFRDEGFIRFPPARAASLGGRDDEALARALGRALAEEVASVGANVNFAPILDVDSNPANPVIGDRALSGAVDIVSRLGSAFVRGTLDAGVVPVGKHFPGHGDAATDSHHELPVVDAELATLFSREIPPFREALRAGLPALMTAHVVYPALDPDLPATLSPRILRDLLRGRLLFGGVVFTDALEMKAIADRWGMGDAAVASIRAGCDVPLVCNGEENVEAALEGIARAHRDDPGFRRAARFSARRIDRLRRKVAAMEETRGPVISEEARPGSDVHRALATQLSTLWAEHRGVTKSSDGRLGE